MGIVRCLVHRIDQPKEGYCFALPGELLGHFKSKAPTPGMARQRIGSFWLHLAYVREVQSGNSFERSWNAIGPVERRWSEPIDRSIALQITCNLLRVADITEAGVQNEKRRQCAVCVKGNQSRQYDILGST